MLSHVQRMLLWRLHKVRLIVKTWIRCNIEQYKASGMVCFDYRLTVLLHAEADLAAFGCLMLPSGLAHCKRPKPPLLGPAKREPWPAASRVSCADSLGCKGGSLASKASGASACPLGLPFVGLLDGEAEGLISAFCTRSIGAFGCTSDMFPKPDSANGFAITCNAGDGDAYESRLKADGW